MPLSFRDVINILAKTGVARIRSPPPESPFSVPYVISHSFDSLQKAVKSLRTGKKIIMDGLSANPTGNYRGIDSVIEIRLNHGVISGIITVNSYISQKSG